MSTSRRRKRAYHHGDLRAALLRSAEELLEKQGLESLSLREAARRARVSHAAPYRHFPTRDALLAALAARGFERFGAGMEAAERSGGLRARGEAYVRFALAHPQLFRLMFGSRPGGDAALGEQAARTFGGLQQSIAAHAGQEAPYASIAAWALVHGLSHLLLDQKVAGVSRDPAQLRDFIAAVLGSVRFSVAPPQRSA